MNRILALPLSLLLLISCGESTKVNPKLENSSSEKSNRKMKSSENLESFNKLVSGLNGNFSLARFLVNDVKDNDYQEAKKISNEEIDQYLNELEQHKVKIKKRLTFGDYKFANDTKFINLSILSSFNSYQKSSYNSTDDIRLISIKKERSKLINEIENLYFSRISSLSMEIASATLFEIKKDKKLTRQLIEEVQVRNSQDAIKAIKKNKKVIEKVNLFLKNSNLTYSEQSKTLVLGAFALGIYETLKKNPKLDKLIKKVKKLKKKIDEVLVLTKAIQRYHEQVLEHSEKFLDTSKFAYEGLKKEFESVKFDVSLSSNERRKITKAIYNRFINNSKISEPVPSLLEKKFDFIDRNLLLSFDSAAQVVNGVSGIISNTHLLAKKFGIKVPEQIVKVEHKIQKFQSKLNLVTSVVKGLSSKGLMGGLAALSSPTALGGMVTGGANIAFQKEVMSKLSVIDQKLDQVLLNQKRILENQVDMMKMIHKLALVIDDYHSEQVSLLSEIRDISLVNRALEQIKFGENIKGCETLIANYDLGTWESPRILISPYRNSTFLDLKISNLKNHIKDSKEIYRFLNYDPNSFENCKKSLLSVFQSVYFEENPVRRIFNSSVNENLLSFERDLYTPLVELLPEQALSNPSTMALHVPMQTFKNYKMSKLYYLNTKASKSNNELYQIESLISVKALERYVNSLLVFYPFLDLAADEWSSGLEQITNNYIEQRKLFGQPQSLLLLRNALSLIRSGIAQEAILSGEPLFEGLRGKKNLFKSLKVKDCKSPISNSNKTACSIRKNKTLMSNLISYTLDSKIEDGTLTYLNYKFSLENNRFEDLQKMIGLNIKIVEKKGRPGIMMFEDDEDSSFLPLPDPRHLESRQILYSARMKNLIRMHDQVLEAAALVSPQNLSPSSQKIAAKVLIDLYSN